MDMKLFDFDLPKENIAIEPARPRDSARLLCVANCNSLPDQTGQSGLRGEPALKDQAGLRNEPALKDQVIMDLAQFLRAGDMMVFNDTRVIPGRLKGMRGLARVEVTLHKQAGPCDWWAFAKPARKCALGDLLDFSGLQAEVIAIGEAGERLLRFNVTPDAMMPSLIKYGEMPLPPYIAAQRPAGKSDEADYQTLFARHDGAVAAPTAGLHFTDKLLASLDERGVERATITLHVGAGTFLPVKTDNSDTHKMHSEWGRIDGDVAQKLNACRNRGGRIIAVGTTSLRLLETAADDQGIIHPFEGDTDIFIRPGYRFKAVDRLLTNFHLPKSTLFMLVSAFSGLETMQKAYAHAVREGYRFYSYGDACLLYPQKDNLL